jgi:pyruvate formate lyase activating enzyme
LLLEPAPALAAGDPLADLIRNAPRARYWVSSATGECAACHAPGSVAAGAKPSHRHTVIRCQLCARNCTLAEGERGLCRARIHVNGELKSLVYGRPITVHVDPIEKKPFFHFLPGAAAYSLATSGCPLRCRFCQNWEISQARPEDYAQTPVAPASLARGAVQQSAPVIAFTYNEPTVFTEFLTDVARAGKPLGRRAVLVSCGFMNEAPLAEMCEVLDAIKIDLKGFSQDFYHDVCGADLAPVLRSIKQVGKSGRHLEIVNLVVPTLNDSPKMLTELAKWVVGEVGPDVPVHFTRFHPDYQLPNLPDTPVATLERARDAAMQQGLRYAYVGNVPGHPGNNTYCPKCGKAVIERDGLFVTGMHLKNGHCAYCGREIPGVWS